jgi:hypothetical protein
MPHEFTILEAGDARRFCKVYTPAGSNAYDKVYQVRAEVWTACTLTDVYDILERLETMRDRCIIRGEPLFDDKTWTRRLMRSETPVARKDNGEPAFASRDHAWLCLDLDDVERPEGWEDARPLRMVDALVPAPFAGAGLVWQWSAGARPGGKIRAHVWYLLDRPACDASLRDWLRELGVADLSLYNAVQIHYTAAPVFEGLDDPMPQRLLMRQGDLVVLPECVVDRWSWRKIEEQAKLDRERAARAALRTTSLVSRGGKAGRYARAALAAGCRRIAEAGEGARHQTLCAEATGLWGLVLKGTLEESAWEHALTEVAESVLPADRVAQGEVQNILRWAKTHGEERI